MKLLIVDDDVYTREGLAENVDWSLYGIQEVMQAENGGTALAVASWYQPEIVITDIRMPKKDGISFCRQLRRIVPVCQIIFITGFMDTEYLKSAIQLSAVAFIEKPVQVSEVMEAVDLAVREIKKERERDELKKDNLDYQKKHLIHLLTEKPKERKALQEACEKADFPVGTDWMYLCCIIEIRKIVSNMEEIIQELVVYMEQTAEVVLAGAEKDRYFPLVMAFKKHRRREVELTCRRLTSFRMDYIIAIGYFVENIFNIYNSRRMAEAAIQKAYFDPENRYFEITQIPVAATIDPVIYREFLNIYQENPFMVAAWYKKLINRTAEENKFSKNQIISLTKSLAHKMITDNPSILSEQKNIRAEDAMFETMDRTHTVSELLDIFMTLCRRMEECREEQNKYSRIVGDMRYYCQQNLSDSNLDGQMISEHFHMSIAHLNFLFKQELNLTIKQYISNLRIEKAKEILRDTYRTVDETAALCGYSTGNYFAKAFKEAVKMTPSEYRKLQEKTDEKKK